MWVCSAWLAIIGLEFVTFSLVSKDDVYWAKLIIACGVILFAF